MCLVRSHNKLRLLPYSASEDWFCVTVVESVYCAVRAESLYKTNAFSFKRVNISGHGPGSSVGIVTNYGLNGPESNTGGDEIFRPSRPALGPTQLPVQWVSGLYRR